MARHPLCRGCGVALSEPGAVCSVCGTRYDSHSAAVSASIEADRRLRFRLVAAALGVLLLGIVAMFANWSSSPAESPTPAPIVKGPDYNEVKLSPAPSEGSAVPSPAPSDSTVEQHETVSSEVPADDSGDHELREDGRVYCRANCWYA